jgi:hypothetical protein
MGELAQTLDAKPTRRGLPTPLSVLLGAFLAVVGLASAFCAGLLGAYAAGDPDITGSAGETAAPLGVVVFTTAVVCALVPLSYPLGRRRWKLWVILGVLISAIPLVYLPYAALSARNWPKPAVAGGPTYSGLRSWIALVVIYAGTIVAAVVVFSAD